ncbi:MAG TPA: T9SS type A sorting domain-containing protein [Flavobacteriaceae bacterium]|nr:T9SS type A sorting domain-containing protein [Flavobacteriaceae bacterium]
MRKITLLAAALVAFTFSNNADAQQILSHSVDQTVIEGGVACANGTGGYTANNLWWRSYVLADFGVTSDFAIGGVQFGVGTIDLDNYDVTVTVYLNSGGAFPAGTRTPLTSATATVSTADMGTVVDVIFASPITVPAASEIVISLDAPSLETQVQNFRIGQNELGESAPSYLSSPVDCGIADPVTTESLGFPDDIILNLAEDGALGVQQTEAMAQISLYPNPVQGQLNITLPSSVQLQSATMYDLLGKATSMNIGENNTLNTANLSSGVYILKLETNQGVMTKKVIKN